MAKSVFKEIKYNEFYELEYKSEKFVFYIFMIFINQ